jgi:predicted HTH domain antitoxin
VSGSDCLALLPEALLQSGLLRERLVALPVEEELPAYAVALFQRAEVALTSAARSLAAQFEREAHYRSVQEEAQSRRS